MTHWKSQIDARLPAWQGYRKLLGRLGAVSFPDTRALNRLLPPEASSLGGHAVRFVPAGRVPGVQYERHIFETGEVSTREKNWHDVFNALVWCRLPRFKAAMNARHYQEMGREAGGRRGKLRDALTLLDECGVVISGSNPEVLQSLASRDWNAAFVTHRSAWRSECKVLVCGHALLEKFLKPYKSMTAHALIIYAADPLSPVRLDELLGAALTAGRLFDSPAGLSPLPLMGIPGWWPAGEQNRSFYRDTSVFRPPPERMIPAPVHHAGSLWLQDDPGHMKTRPWRPQ